MDDRVVDFIRGLRAAGVRVSLAESVDAMNAVSVLGITDKDTFRETLRATLVKERDGFAAFNELFPLYFGSGGPALENALEDLNADDQDLLKAALEAMSGNMQRLLDWLTSGQGPTKEELEKLARQSGIDWADNQQQGRWVTRRMLQQMGYGHLEDMMRELHQKLQQMGMSQEAIEKLMGVVDANRDALAQQVAEQIGLQIAQQRADRPDDLHGSDLMQKSFSALSEEEADRLRKEVTRLVSQLRSRAALRRKRGNKGKFDSKGTIRANQQYGGIPIELKYRKKKLKPSLVVICDMSRSMLVQTEFMLHLIYALQDQVAKTRSFAFYSDMQEISITLAGRRPEAAIQEVFESFYGDYPSHYATDLGNSLNTLHQNWWDAINGRSTVVIMGDGRNNYNSPRTDLIKEIQRRAKNLIWFCSEPERQWGTGDSDMWDYKPLCDQVFVVRNLAQLATAVDKLMAS